EGELELEPAGDEGGGASPGELQAGERIVGVEPRDARGGDRIEPRLLLVPRGRELEPPGLELCLEGGHLGRLVYRELEERLERGEGHARRRRAAREDGERLDGAEGDVCAERDRARPPRRLGRRERLTERAGLGGEGQSVDARDGAEHLEARARLLLLPLGERERFALYGERVVGVP